MSTVSEIEAALSHLSVEELARIESTIRERLRQMAGASVADLERENGFDAFPERAGAPVTVEAVRQLCADEGI